MTVAVVYCHPRVNQKLYIGTARRFKDSYLRHPAGETPHDVYVVLNGDSQKDYDAKTFSPLPVKFISHDNSGKDIGAFQFAARVLPHDLLIFVGSCVWFRKAGWLDVMVSSVLKNGPGVYGAYAFHEPAIHIRTTCFWMPRELLLMYPHLVGNDMRYLFEHGGKDSITEWTINSGFGAWLVTWKGIFPPEHWRHVENDEALILDQHSDRIGYK